MGHEWISAISSITTAVVAVVAVIVGLKQLFAWKSELRGRHDFELSRNIGITSMQLRDAILKMRNPFVSISESVASAKELGINLEAMLSVDTQRRASVSVAYEMR